jgi:hypothetical protein
VIIPPLALIFGAAIGLLARGHRRAVILIAISAPVLSVAAFALQFVPGGAEECQSSISGSTVCHSLPAVSGWDGPFPYAIATCLVLLSLAAPVSIRVNRWWIPATSAVLQSVPQVISFGGFLDWTPALIATTSIAFAIAWQRSPHPSGHESVSPPPPPASMSE